MIQVSGPNESIAVIMLPEVDEQVLQQVHAMLRSPAIQNCTIRIMPDTHVGKGSVIGFTAQLPPEQAGTPLRIIPNVVGVDIGCGIYSFNLGKAGVKLEALDGFIRSAIPHGFAVHERKPASWSEDTFGGPAFRALLKALEVDGSQVAKSLGTLGGGNHFIEMGTDPAGNRWLTIHSGSRNFGLQVATHYQKKAKASCAREKRHAENGLEYLEGDEAKEYLRAMAIAQKFAHANRMEMASAIIKYLNAPVRESILSVHNYIDLHYMTIRKGAISARSQERVLIPFNMRDGVAVASGKGNADWNFSAPHGAGRKYSRSKAKQQLQLKDFKKDMKGIYTTCVSQETIDESPAAYKSMQLIMREISPTAEVEFMIKPVYNFKAT